METVGGAEIFKYVEGAGDGQEMRAMILRGLLGGGQGR